MIRIVAACALLVGCSGQPGAAALYGPSIGTIELEVAYVAGAAPYVGAIPPFGKDAWRLTQVNLEGSSGKPGLFTGTNKTFVIPRTLDELELVTSAPGGSFENDGTTATSYTQAQIEAIAKANRKQASTGGTASFYVLFLDGYFADGTLPRTDVLGISIGATGIVAMFKPVIVAAADPAHPYEERFVEQAVLIHELGHAAGLVDNGIAMVAPHEDTAHPTHCSNPACVMYWLNDGGGGARAFVQKYVTTGDDVLFGSECLADAARAAGR